MIMVMMTDASIKVRSATSLCHQNHRRLPLPTVLVIFLGLQSRNVKDMGQLLVGLVALWVGKCPYGLPIAPSIGHSERHPVSKTSIDRIKIWKKDYFVDAFATNVCVISQRRYRGDGDRIWTWFRCWAVHSSECLHDENHQQHHLPLV